MPHNVLSELFSSVLLVLGGVVLFLKEFLCVPMCVSLYLHVFLVLFVRLFCFILLLFFGSKEKLEGVVETETHNQNILYEKIDFQ